MIKRCMQSMIRNEGRRRGAAVGTGCGGDSGSGEASRGGFRRVLLPERGGDSRWRLFFGWGDGVVGAR